MNKYGLPLEVIEKINQIFKQHDKVSKVLIYGSRAKDLQKHSSDIDLCIESDTLTLKELFKIENQLDDLLLPWKIDLSIKKLVDNHKLLLEIEKHGDVFYDK